MKLDTLFQAAALKLRGAFATFLAALMMLTASASFAESGGVNIGSGLTNDSQVVAVAASFTPEKRVQKIASEAVTRQTEVSGKRHSNTTDWSRFNAPDGMVINRDATQVRIVNQYGSEHTYKVQYGDFVEVVPGSGIMAPTMVEVQTHARSGRAIGSRGVMKIEVDVTMTRYRAQADASAG